MEMSLRSKAFVNRLTGFFEVFGSATAVANAVESGREPRSRDLKTLGIAPESFRAINRF
jgi:hypothetical protein